MTASPRFAAPWTGDWTCSSRFGVDLRPVFLAGWHGSGRPDAALNRPSVQLPLVFLIEQSLVALWEYFGVRPAALIGHSMGENAAACVAGVFSMEDGTRAGVACAAS